MTVEDIREAASKYAKRGFFNPGIVDADESELRVAFMAGAMYVYNNR